jgi:hypothetical protein
MEHAHATVIFNIRIDEHIPAALSWFELADRGCIFVDEVDFSLPCNLGHMFTPVSKRTVDDPYVIMIHVVVER